MNKYRQPMMSIEEFFDNWKSEMPHEKIKKKIYNEYRTYHIVFNRDNHRCQVDGCTFRNSPITIHHFKHKSNGGKTKPHNCVTICRAHQDYYHEGKGGLTFKSGSNLPVHMRGFTQILDSCVNATEPDIHEILKSKKGEHRDLRKKFKQYWGITLSWDMIAMLIKWLYVPIE